MGRGLLSNGIINWGTTVYKSMFARTLTLDLASRLKLHICSTFNCWQVCQCMYWFGKAPVITTFHNTGPIKVGQAMFCSRQGSLKCPFLSFLPYTIFLLMYTILQSSLFISPTSPFCLLNTCQLTPIIVIMVVYIPLNSSSCYSLSRDIYYLIFKTPYI
jgi:hypothetical protein